MSAPNRTPLDAIRDYLLEFRVLKEVKREYWITQVINLLDCTIYFAMLTVASLFLSDELGFSDADAGYILTIFTVGTTLCLLFMGLITDWLGIRLSLQVALTAMLLLRTAVALLGLSPDLPFRGLLVSVCLALMAPFMAMMMTSFQAANKRFTNAKSRGAGFTLWYLFMNIGAALGGFAVDIVREGMGLSYAHIFTMGSGLAVLCLVALFLFMKDESQAEGEGGEPAPSAEAPAAKREKKSPLQIAREVFSESAFWKLSALIGLTLGVRAVFSYFYLLMPKYWVRIIGEGALIGNLNAINPILIVIGLILFTPLANKFDLFKMLTRGAAVSALSLFVLVLPWSLFSSDIGTAHYVMAIVFIVILSVGEILWSPKLSEYTAAVAPKGQEGTYMGFTMIPWFLAKTIVSVLSGHMLMRWVPEAVKSCPEGAAPDACAVVVPGVREQMLAGTLDFWSSPAAMWLILGIIALGGVLIAILLEPWFTKGARWRTEKGA